MAKQIYTKGSKFSGSLEKALIKPEKDGVSYLRYKLTPQGKTILRQLSVTSLYKEIETGLKEIGHLPDLKTDNINYVWAYDVL